MDKFLVEKYRKEMLEKYGGISSAAAATYRGYELGTD